MKKLLISFLIGIVFIFSLAPFSIAKAQSQTTWYNQNPFEWYAKVYDTTNPNEIFGERYTAAQVQWVAYSVFFLPINTFFSLIGMKTSPVECLAEGASGVTDVSTCLSQLPDAITALANNFAQITDASQNPTLAQTNDKNFILKDILQGNRPLSGIAYVKNLANKFSPVTKAEAAGTTGFGYTRIGILGDLWTATRNIAYFFFVIFMLVAAFMIMFKVKISPQAVVTLQSALPKIALSILLVTFSYAIAGFMVDLVYVVMGLFSQFFPFMTTTVGGPDKIYLFLTGWTKEGFIAILIYSVLYIVYSIIAACLIGTAAIFTGNVASVVFGAIMVVAFFIIAIIIIIYIFVGLFNLFKALAMFYLDVILGPIRLAFGALPQSKGAFSGWLKSMISHLAVFPATAAMWFFGFMFLDKSMQSLFACGIAHIGPVDQILQSMGDLFPTVFGAGTVHWFNWSAVPGAANALSPMACWGPPLLGNGASATSIAFLLLSASCILLIGKIPKMIESALKGERFDIEAAIGEPVKKVGSFVGGTIEASGLTMQGREGEIRRGIGGALQQLSR